MSRRILSRLLSLFLAMGLCFLFPLVGCSAEEKGEDFTVLTWNVYLGNGDSDCVLSLLEESSPSVIQMQEANPQAYKKFIQPFVAAHPQYFVLDTAIDGEPLRTPVLFDTDRFSFIDGGAELLEDGFKPTNTKTLGWVLLESREGKRLLCVNFHGVKCLARYEGYENYTQEERAAVEEEWHIGNARQILRKIESVRAEYGDDVKTVVTGDCNFNSSSQAYRLIVEAGYKDAEESAKKRTKDGMRTSHTLGVQKSGEGLSIDHVFSDAYMGEHRIVRTREAYYGSDHCPVFVTAKL